MKTRIGSLLTCLFLTTTTQVFSQKLMIPDYIASSEKIPVVADFPYPAAFKQTRSGVYLFNQDLGVPIEKKSIDLDRLFLEDQAANMANQVANELNQQFNTDKFYYLDRSEVESDGTYQWNENNIFFFVSCLMTIDYSYASTVDSKYSVAKRSYMSFYYVTDENRARPVKGFNYMLETEPFTYFEVEEEYLKFRPAEEFLNPDIEQEYPKLKELLEIHPYDQYLQGFSNGVEPGVIRAKEKIMKKYKKKKK